MTAADWVPVIDVSRHQGVIDFARARAQGVAGVIIRATHGQAVDDRFAGYWRATLEAGYTRDDLAVYTFLNPKRGTGRQTAEATLEAIARVVGDTEVGYMLDVEAYAAQSPLPGTATLAGPAFADYIREHQATAELAGARVFAYSNRSFWNGPSHRPGVQWVGDAELAASLDFIVPRYPVHSLAGYASSPVPVNPALWDEWAFSKAAGPLAPIGATWSGWQFSADFNRRGATYGASSSDLDLNIVLRDAWARWTTPQGDHMSAVAHTRIVDTRRGLGGARLTAGVDRLVNVPATIPRPSWARGIIVNIGTDLPAADGYICADATTPDPSTSAHGFVTARRNDSTGATITVTPLEGLAAASFVVRSTAAVDLIIDVQGWTA